MSWFFYFCLGTGAFTFIVLMDALYRARCRRPHRRSPIARQTSVDTQKLGEFVRERMKGQSS